MDADAREYLLSADPLIVRRRVLWGECDPAGVVYTPRFADYAASARDYWFRHVLRHDDRPTPGERRITYPMRAMQFDFRSMLAPDDLFDMTVTLREVRTRSFTLSVEARHARGSVTFLASMSQVAFDQALGKAVPIPPPLDARMAALITTAGA